MENDFVERVRQRKRGRELAAELLTLLPELADGDDLSSEPLRQGLMAGFRSWIDLPEDRGDFAMTKEQAVKFENIPIAFGQFQGKPHGEVPIRYLMWLYDQYVPLTKYLTSDVAQRRVEDELA